ncbi:MAG: response regulator [Clostridiales bacterium]|nr:response regulator [Clostridiales bacterium]
MPPMQNESFDLRKLVAVESLGARRFADSRPALSAEDYYHMLTLFLSHAPDVSRALGRFEKREGDRDARRSLDDMIGSLEAMGCELFIVEFHSILDSYEGEGNWRLAATYARRVKDDFDDFFQRLAGARDRSPEPEKPDGSLTLKEAIKRMDEQAASVQTPADTGAGAGSMPLILAVDDSPVILQSVWAVLNNEYRVLTLTNPADIGKVLEKQSPDLFLLDYQMPELSGFELIPIIRNYAEHKDTPIVFLTSDGSIDNVTGALALGARDYIVKPFMPETLREKISKLIPRVK